jgi:hypothetical protein
MNITDSPIVAALLVMRPGAQWAIVGGDLSTLQWDDKVQTRPTDAEIMAQIGSK